MPDTDPSEPTDDAMSAWARSLFAPGTDEPDAPDEPDDDPKPARNLFA